MSAAAVVLLTSCGSRELVLSLPERDLQSVASRDKFDPIPYLESVRIVMGPLTLDTAGKEVMANFIFDAYHYPLHRSYVEYSVEAKCDLVKLIESNYLPTNQSLVVKDGRVRVAQLVELVRPYARNTGVHDIALPTHP